MAEYYLISQLPSLDAVGDSTPLPITPERFDELCRSHLGQKALSVLGDLTLLPPQQGESVSSGFAQAWNDAERGLRLALAKVRAEKLKKSFDPQSAVITPEQLKTATEAVGIEDPLEAEKYLNRCRLAFLETLRPMEPFSVDYIYYYSLKLRLLQRMRSFDTAAGTAAYRNIYHSILCGDDQEVTQ